jgi:CDP-glucose 4,6-dehydratase
VAVEFIDAYRGARVLVTGHTGFKGSWLGLWLLALGADVHGVALAPRSERDNFVVTGLAGRLHHHLLDIRERDALADRFEQIRPEVVFHLAAQALVGRSHEDPPETFATNLLGTVHVLEAIRRTPSVRAAVIITSDKCYRNLEWEWGYRETDVLGGLDPYGASKACAELAVDAYRASFFRDAQVPAVASTRAGNVIGGGDWSEHRIVPDIVRALLANRGVELRSPRSTRPWQFVLEPLSGYLWLGALLGRRGDLSSAWNFGPEAATIVPVQLLADQIVAAWGGGEIRDVSGGGGFPEATLLSLDIAKARQRLGWRPVLTLAETIDATVAWYKSFAAGAAMHDLALQQIGDYCRKARQRGLPWAP